MKLRLPPVGKYPAHPSRKLDAAAVRDIRSYAPGRSVPYAMLCAKYGVSQRTVYTVVVGRFYREVTS